MADEITEAELDRLVQEDLLLAEQRAKYTDAQVEALGKEGNAFKNPDGHYSFPIGDLADLANAIQAIGRAPEAVRDAVKAYIKKRAGELKATDKLPEDWRSADEGEHRAKDGMETCSTCEGSGKIMEGNRECPDCGGSGEVEAGGQEENSADDGLEKRKHTAEILDGTPERRDFTADFEVRDTSDGGLRFTGYASTTETPYEVADFNETIARGAFKRTLGEKPDVAFLVNHEGIPMARTRSGTLTLSEDARGLRVDADLDPTDPTVQAILPAMRRGDLTEMSFAFRATNQEWDEKYENRTIKEVSIHRGDVSMVTMGANAETSGEVSFRSAGGDVEIRVGKKHSAATKAEIEGAIEHLQGLIEEPAEEEPVVLADPLAQIIPSGIESERAKRAKALARAA